MKKKFEVILKEEIVGISSDIGLEIEDGYYDTIIEADEGASYDDICQSAYEKCLEKYPYFKYNNGTIVPLD